MKLQFLGDSRDSFKWDLLHHAVTQTTPAFRELLVVPMLTPDVPALRHGSTSAERYPAKPQLLAFVRGLAGPQRTLETVTGLGCLPGLPSFDVTIYGPSQRVGFGWARDSYWRGLNDRLKPGSLVFLDPDNGLETPTQAGEQHVRFSEVRALLTALPPTAAIVVFQYRPQGQSWASVFRRIEDGFPQQYSFAAIHDGQLAFVFMAAPHAMRGLRSALQSYAALHMGLHQYSQSGV